MTREPRVATRVARAVSGLPPGARVRPGALIHPDAQLGTRRRLDSEPRGLSIGSDARIGPGATIADGVEIGDRLVAGGNVLIDEGVVLGDDCRVGENTIIATGCRIGDRVTIDANCYIAELTTIEDDVTIAPGACFASDPHPGSETHLCTRGPTIKRGAQIGMNATILPFVTVGERSLIGAGSVVTKNVPDEIVVAGNPARILKSVARVSCPLDVVPGEYLRRQQAR